jgi:hypothetical protein
MSDARFVRDYRREIPGGYEIVYEYNYNNKHIIGVEFIDPAPKYAGLKEDQIYYYYDSRCPDTYRFNVGDIVSIPTMYCEAGARAIVRNVVQHADNARDKRITLLLMK